MNTRHSNYTGRMHRTLTDAFGPYAHGSQLQQPRQDPMPTVDKIVVVSGLILMAVVVALVMMGVIK